MNFGQQYWKLAFRNVFRNKRRSFLTMVVIMFSVGAFIFFQSYFEGIMNDVIEDTLKATGHLSIEHPDYRIKSRMLSLSVPVSDFEALRAEVNETTGVRSVAGRIRFGALLDFGEDNEPGLGMGIDPEPEREIMKLENSIVDGRYFSGKPNDTVIGIEFAKRLKISVGDTITVIARTAYGSLAAENLIVTGVADLLNSHLNRVFYMPLPTAQRLLDMDNKVTEMIVYLRDLSLLDTVMPEIKNLPGIKDTYAVRTWEEKGSLEDLMPMVRTVFAIMATIIGMIAAFSIINTMLMAVLERTPEIGVFSAFGMKKRSVLAVFIIEAMFLGCFGGFMGIAAGGFGGYLLETYGISLGDSMQNMPIPIRQVIYGDLELQHIYISFGLGLLLSIVAAYLPALKAARMEPVDALRHR